MTDQFNFDRANVLPDPVCVKFRGAEYELRPATGGAAKRFHNARVGCIKRVGPDGKPLEYHNVGELEPLLVALCLFDSKGKRVPQPTVEEWPADIVAKLYAKAIEISGLEEKAKPTAAAMLVEVLQLPDAPCSLVAVRQFVESLDDSYQPLKEALAPTPEELAKNLLPATPDGLE